ncbi:MAG TPA: hypothetical protein DCM62_03255 [Bacteroidales bacterium]|nr:hypothetical protein [Bacteroidales bacterium]
MTTKLTLRLNQNVIAKAKTYARSHKTSISKMIESYLDNITRQKEEYKKTTITSLVESLSGVIDLPADFDIRKEYGNYLEKKYS